MTMQLERLKGLAPMLGFVALFAAFIGVVLVPGYRAATELAATTSALKLVAEQRGQPEVVARSLATLRDQLEAGQYVGRTLKDLAGAVAAYDSAIAQLERDLPQQTVLAEIAALWSAHRERLSPIVGFKGMPYRDSDSAGARMTAQGRALLSQTREALKAGRSETGQLTDAMASIGTALQRDAADGATKLRHLMIVGVLFAGSLVALLVYLQLTKARHERIAQQARAQTLDILATVKEGLFLLDSDFRIGQTRSTALSALMRRDDFDGKSFDDLLFGLVPEKTLETAMKYVKLLWGERANENLIKSINPLAEVEVNFGRGDVRYLEFDFHRVKGERGVRQVLVSVSDVTSRVLLARELRQSQSDNAVHMDVLHGLLRIDPQQMSQFLSDSEAELNQVNALLRVPVREQPKFRQKVDELFREMHKLKGEAAALGVISVESRAHAFEDLLKELRERPELSGNDFVPLVVRLDDLFAHLKSLGELCMQLGGLRTAAQAADRSATQYVRSIARTAPDPVLPPSVPLSAQPGLQVAAALENLAQRVAADHGRQVRLVAQGFELVPPAHLRAVRGIAIQFVRNAVVHGIEDAATRSQQGKPALGTLHLTCRPCSEGFEIVFQDDGGGLVAERIRGAAVQRGAVSAEEAATMDERAVLALIFRPGFSTHDGNDTDAGRGVGLDLVSKWVRALGGQIGVSTSPGRFTRFRVVLPVDTAAQNAVA
jgi:two-component system chemotaxis sensor kinase CheA